MNRSNLVRLVLAAVLACAAGAALAQQALEIIPLRHRTVEQVLPSLQPLVEPGGTLSGSRGQLFLRASPANVAEIKRALEAIDRPSRRLQISVRFDDAQERERRAVGASGTIGSGGAHVDLTAEDSRRSAGERVDQRLQVLEGSRAFIFAGQFRPLRIPGQGR
jgi:type II secretory pathway component GspD/PulD (secretin)